LLIQIGRRGDRSQDDVVGALLACHDRIRAFTAMAQRLPAGAATPVEVADAAARVERYFRVALPLHLEDEELSLCPRLLAAPVAPEVIDAVSAMTGEHAPIEALVACLLPRWATLARHPLELTALAAELARDTAELDRLFQAHLEREEQVLFPAVREHLAGGELLIRAEMAARRSGADRHHEESAPQKGR
jgi:hypothetical protein